MPMLTSSTSSSALPVPLGTKTITSALSAPGSTGNRVPIVIKGELKRTAPLEPPSRQARRKHSKRLWLLGMSIVLLTISATLLGFTPQGQELTAKIGGVGITGDGTVISQQQNNNALAPAALATTTWMYQNDGYDPYSHGEVNVSDGTSSLPWPYGQCTYWANYRYHRLTGYWVQWTGNADQWFLGAQKAGWDYGQTPPPGVPSIIVLMPYVQLAGGVGHVAVVESISGNVVHTSNMNWGYGGWTHTEMVDFTLGPGVYFVWHKPAN
jgi:surface antigen